MTVKNLQQLWSYFMQSDNLFFQATEASHQEVFCKIGVHNFW